MSAAVGAVVPGGNLDVTDTTQNLAPVAAAATTTRYYLSLDQLRNTGDRLLTGPRPVPALGPGEASTGTVA